MVRFDEPLVRALGDKTAKELAAGLDLHTVGDLMHHYPRRYAKRGDLTPLKDIRVGDHVTVQVDIVSSTVRKTQTGKQLAEIQSGCLDADMAEQKELLQARLGDEVFVATWMRVQQKDSERIESITTWTEGVPTLLPRADNRRRGDRTEDKKNGRDPARK